MLIPVSVLSSLESKTANKIEKPHLSLDSNEITDVTLFSIYYSPLSWIHVVLPLKKKS